MKTSLLILFFLANGILYSIDSNNLSITKSNTYREAKRMSFTLTLAGPGLAHLGVDLNLLKFLNFGVGFDLGTLLALKLLPSEEDVTQLLFPLSSRIYFGKDRSSAFFVMPAVSVGIYNNLKDKLLLFVSPTQSLFIGYEFRKIFLFRIFGGVIANTSISNNIIIWPWLGLTIGFSI